MTELLLPIKRETLLSTEESKLLSTEDNRLYLQAEPLSTEDSNNAIKQTILPKKADNCPLSDSSTAFDLKNKQTKSSMLSTLLYCCLKYYTTETFESTNRFICFTVLCKLFNSVV